MGYRSTRKARLEAQLVKIQAQITALDAVILEMVASGVKSYSLDSGEGSQKTTRRSFKEIKDMVRELTAEESHYINELSRVESPGFCHERPLCGGDGAFS